MAPDQSIHEAAKQGKTDELKRLLKDNPGDLESKDVSCAPPSPLSRGCCCCCAPLQPPIERPSHPPPPCPMLGHPQPSTFPFSPAPFP